MMKHTRFTRAVSIILCLVLAAATALSATGCNTPTPSTDPTASQTVGDATVLGEGQTSFSFTVTDGNGASTAYEIHTDKDTVGAALMELGLIAGEAGEFGLYVKTVDGITADYDVDGTYWAFFINGEYAMSGVDVTPIEAGALYEMKVEKG